MDRYTTLGGLEFDFGTLPLRDYTTVRRILDIERTAKSEDGFLQAARRTIRDLHPTYPDLTRVLSGAVGAVYRDLWYRRQLVRALEIGEGEAQRILKNVRSHPARLIHDAFLDMGVLQSEFALQVGVSTPVISKLVQSFKPRSNQTAPEDAVSSSTIIEILNRLEVAPYGVYSDRPPSLSSVSEPPVDDFSSVPTVRERLLLTTIVDSLSKFLGPLSQRESRVMTTADGETPTTPVHMGDVDQLADRLARLFNTIEVRLFDALIKSVVAVSRPADSVLSKYSIRRVLEEGDARDVFEGRPSKQTLRLLEAWKRAPWARARLESALAPASNHETAEPSTAGGAGKTSATNRLTLSRITAAAEQLEAA